MDTEVRTNLPEKLFSVISRCRRVQNGWQFSSWLQHSVADYIPHKALIAVWGKFKSATTSTTLHYDFISEREGVKSSVLQAYFPEINHCMSYLHQLWLDNDGHYYVLNNIGTSEFGCKLRRLFPLLPSDINSILIFGISDFHGEQDCLYMFFSEQPTFRLMKEMVGMVMPHVDHLLRKIKHGMPAVSSAKKSSVPPKLVGLTMRELEVIDWIKAGKTNQEIALILHISENTIKSHLKRIYQKLNVSKRAQAVAVLAMH